MNDMLHLDIRSVLHTFILHILRNGSYFIIMNEVLEYNRNHSVFLPLIIPPDPFLECGDDRDHIACSCGHTRTHGGSTLLNLNRVEEATSTDDTWAS